MNCVQLMGRLTRDPEIRQMQNDKQVVSFSLAIDRFGKKDETDYFDCQAWDKQAELIYNSCKKGHRLVVWGRLRQDRWQDQQSGQTRTAVRVQVQSFNFVEYKDQGQQQTPMPMQQAPMPMQQQPYGVPPMPQQQYGQPQQQQGQLNFNQSGQPQQQQAAPMGGQWIPFNPDDIPF